MEVVKSTWLARGLLLCFLAQVPPALCHLPELFGMKYIRFIESPTGTAPLPGVSQLAEPVKLDRLQFEQLLADAEVAGGPYMPDLTDPLINLAHYHQVQEDVEDALEAYSRALHLVRVNEGLFSTQQLPILREMLALYRTVGDRRSLGNAYQYYYRVSKLGDLPLTPERLELSLEYLRWERQLYASRVNGDERAPLLRAYQANQSMLESLVPTTDQELAWYVRLAMSQMRNLYLILGEEPLPMGYASANTGNGMAVDAMNRQLAYIQLTAYSAGKKLLEKCIERTQSSPSAELAALHLELGDWHQWNDQLRHAGKHYVRVVALLRDAGEEQLLSRWLDQPVELPDELDLWPVNGDRDAASQAVVVARYDVTSRGAVQRIQVSVQDEKDLSQAWRIKRMLRDAHFRPRFSQGLAEAVEQVSRRYMLVGAH